MASGGGREIDGAAGRKGGGRRKNLRNFSYSEQFPGSFFVCWLQDVNDWPKSVLVDSGFFGRI